MEFAQQLSLYIGITASILLVAGLFRPWAMLWWEDVQNRRKVIKLYGSIALASFCCYWILTFASQAT